MGLDGGAGLGVRVLAGSQKLMFGKFYDLEVHDASKSTDLVFDGHVRKMAGRVRDGAIGKEGRGYQ